MAKTLLDAVNEVLKRVGVIAGDAGELETLTDSARQRPIDVAIQVVNEGIDEIYASTATPQPKEQAESTIALVAGTRAYALADDLVQLRWPMVDQTNAQYLYEAKGGYNAIIVADPERDDTGLALCAAINPSTGELYLDRTPTATEAGRVYTYQYDKDLELSDAADAVPFGNTVFRAMVPAWVQLWKREMRNEFDGDLITASIGRASRLLPKKEPRTSWCPR